MIKPFTIQVGIFLTKLKMTFLGNPSHVNNLKLSTLVAIVCQTVELSNDISTLKFIFLIKQYNNLQFIRDYEPCNL